MPNFTEARTRRVLFGVFWAVWTGPIRGFTNVGDTAFSEDEMRRPTPYAVPLGLQAIYGL
jgi:hypothetical protein